MKARETKRKLAVRRRDPADGRIVPENVRAVGALYVVAIFEEMRLFQVVDQIVSLFSRGMLPLSTGRAADRLYRWWKEGPTRLGEPERQQLYARAFGNPAHAVALPNDAFDPLLQRFVAAVSEFVRKPPPRDKRRRRPPLLSDETIRKSARELAMNLSRHGYGVVHLAASDLRREIEETLRVLGDPGILSAFGARDAWQVVDQVSASYLGGAANTQRFRTLASSGGTIIDWLASSARSLDRDESLPARRQPLRPVRPTDADLAKAVTQWLAANAGPNDEASDLGGGD